MTNRNTGLLGCLREADDWIRSLGYPFTADEIAAAIALIEQYDTALADAIRRPLGVVPASAEGLVSEADLAEAEKRRPKVVECPF